MTTITVARGHARDLLTAPGVPVLLLALLYVALVPSRSWMPAPSYDEQRTLQAWLWVAASASLLLDPRLRRSALHLARRHRAAVVVTGAVLAWGVLSTALADDPVGGLLEMGLLAGGLVTASCIALVFVSRPRLAAGALVVTAVVALLYFAGDLLTFPGIEGQALWLRGRAGGFDNVRFMNHFHAALLPVAAVGATTRTQRWWVRAVPLLAASTAAFYLLQTEGRAATLALVIAVVAVSVGRRDRVAPWTRAVSLAAVLGVAATAAARLYAVSTGGRSSIVDAGSLVGSSGRVEFWGIALDVMRARPLFGLGPGGFAYFPDGPLLTYVAHPHNSVLQFGAEWGIPVAVAVAFALAYAAWTLVLKPAAPTGDLDTETGISWAVVEAGLSAALLQMLVESGAAGVFMTPVSLVLLGIMLGAVVGVRGLAAGAGGPASLTDAFPPRPVAGRVTVAVMLLVVVLAAAPLGGVLGRDTSDVARQTCLAAEASGGFVSPRFWQQGFRGMPDAECEFSLVLLD